jgi:hypothetical protein
MAPFVKAVAAASVLEKAAYNNHITHSSPLREAQTSGSSPPLPKPRIIRRLSLLAAETPNAP